MNNLIAILDKLLLRGWKTPIIRSATINYGLAASVAIVEAVDAQVVSGDYNTSLVFGALSLATAKWLHSTLTDIRNTLDEKTKTTES